MKLLAEFHPTLLSDQIEPPFLAGCLFGGNCPPIDTISFINTLDSAFLHFFILSDLYFNFLDAGLESLWNLFPWKGGFSCES